MNHESRWLRFSTELWLAWRLLLNKKSLLGGSAPLSMVGLVLGVASLVAAMAVVSGFEVTLRDAVGDITGQVQVVRHGRGGGTAEELLTKVQATSPDVTAAARFARVEALFAHQGRVQGVFLQGVEPLTKAPVLKLGSRVVRGSDSLKGEGDIPGALVGVGLARSYELSIGDRVRVIFPVADPVNPEKFSRKVGEIIVNGIVDLGKFDWNERLILTDLKPLQRLAAIGDNDNGILLGYADPDLALRESPRLAHELGYSVSVTDWRELNSNLFEAVRLERVVIFFVVYVILIVTAFNVTSTLFVNVIRRTGEIALLKSLGLSSRAVLRVFGLQGVLFGVVGLVGGISLGILLSYGVTWAQSQFKLMAAEVYRVEGVHAHLRALDLTAIIVVTLITCAVATLRPALRGSKLSPIEGLRNE